MKYWTIIFLFYCLMLPTAQVHSWGFFAHKKINRLAVFTLPSPMLAFYKYYIEYLTENAVNPDKRRYAVEGEAAKHYLDVDHYQDSALWTMPRYWHAAINAYPVDTLQAHGIIPWHIYSMKMRLTKAFERKDVYQILRLSADIGHYIGDANVPLHTCKNYNGQLTDQHGIHGLWETRLPTLFFHTYDFFVGQADYVEKPQLRAWKAIIHAHQAVDSVLLFEKQLSATFPKEKKYTFEQRGTALFKDYSRAYATAYHTLLQGQVERQLRASIKMIGDFWFTCWVDAGQPDLSALMDRPINQQKFKEHFSKEKIPNVRGCEGE